MTDPGSDRGSDAWPGLLGVGALALAIGCCGVLPVAVAFAGSIAVGTLLGIGAGAVALIGLVGLVVARARRRCVPGIADRRRGDAAFGAKRR